MFFKVVNDIYPEYNEAMDIVFNRCNKIFHYNMFIMKWADFQDYSKWLFDILFEAKKESI